MEFQERLLIVEEGPNAGQSFVLQGMICTLGRTSDNTIAIDSARISRRHAQIKLLPDSAVLEDMGSTNGTWVNGRRITGPYRLSSGDVINLADEINLRFEVRKTGQAEAFTPSMEDWPTEALGGAPPAYAETPPPARPAYGEPYPRYQESETPLPYEPSQPAPAYSSAEATPTPQRSRWFYFGIAVLAVMICLCLALAVYLWFAPVEFWESVFQFFNIPLP